MITLDQTHPTPPFEQIRAQIAAQITSGALAEGQRLPSIRQLAADLRVAAGTVARAYTELESAGLISTSRARGTRVNAVARELTEVSAEATRFARAARRHGVSLDDAVATLRAAWAADSPLAG
ncbi:GntR family transcriptional regulator [Micrococcales bacterium 31B]|nr:GntR family transcriptional regulator [Micrococcales bacterium 31B]